MFWVFIAICLMMLWAIVQKSASMSKDAEYSYSDLYDKVQNGQVQDATIQGNELNGHLKVSPKDEFHTTLPRQLRRLAEGDAGPDPRSTSPSSPRRTTSCCLCCSTWARSC